MKTSKNLISIEDVTVTGNEVAVGYLFNENPLPTTLALDGLTLFAENRNMNVIIFDGCVNGEHEQAEATQEINEHVAENLEEVVLAYLGEYPLPSVSLQLDAMVLRLTA